MIKNIEFTHKHDGETFTVLAEYLDASPLTFQKHQASCPTDLTGEREILDVVVLDASGETFTVLAEYLDTSPLTFDKFQASCPTDLYGEHEILDVVVLDADGGERDSSFVTDAIVWQAIESCKSLVDDVKLDTSGLTYFDLWSEGESYYE